MMRHGGYKGKEKRFPIRESGNLYMMIWTFPLEEWGMREVLTYITYMLIPKWSFEANNRRSKGRVPTCIITNNDKHLRLLWEWDWDSVPFSYLVSLMAGKEDLYHWSSIISCSHASLSIFIYFRRPNWVWHVLSFHRVFPSGIPGLAACWLNSNHEFGIWRPHVACPKICFFLFLSKIRYSKKFHHLSAHGEDHMRIDRFDFWLLLTSILKAQIN